MPLSCCRCGAVRSAALVNADIRREVERARAEGRPVDSRRYAALLEEWAAAVRAEGGAG